MSNHILALIYVLALIAYCAPSAFAVPLETVSAFNTANPNSSKVAPTSKMAARGSGTTDFYYLELDPATGALPVAISSGGLPTAAGYIYVTSVRNDYTSVNVTTGAWVQLVASLSGNVNAMTIFDSCGAALELGVGAPASEARRLLIPPGGIDGQFAQQISAGSRVSVRAVATNCTVGELDITFFQ